MMAHPPGSPPGEWLSEQLDVLVAQTRELNADIREGQQGEAVYAATRAALKRIAPFEVIAFMSSDAESRDFRLSECDPTHTWSAMREEIESHIEKGTFAWVLRRNHAVIMPALTMGGKTLVLHVLSTRNQAVGMFAGVLEETALSESAQKLIAVLLFNAARSLENSRLYERLHIYARELEGENRDRAAAEQELRQSREMLRTVMNHIPAAIFWKDGEGRYLGGNDAFARDAGLAHAGDIIGKGDEELAWAHLAGRLHAEACRILEADKPILGREEYFGEINGRKIWRRISMLPLHDAAGNPAAVLGIYEDITRRREADMERARLEHHIQHLQRLEAIGALAGGIAHDFNNLLSVISGFAELSLAENQDTAVRNQNIREILGAAGQARDLVQQILTFSRQIQPELKRINLARQIDAIAGLLRASLPGDITLEKRIEKDLPPVMADESHLRQIVLNLCNNAQEAMRKGGGTLRISLAMAASSAAYPQPRFSNGTGKAGWLRLRIEDTGHGMVPEIQERIFEPFFTTRPIGEGTGLGLSTVHGIIQELKGFIRVGSAPGQGSRFDCYFPAVEEAATVEISDQAVEAFGSERILFVDDDRLLTELGQRGLSAFGYTITACNSSVEALELFRKNPAGWDLVITDQLMPAMTGTQLAAELHRLRPEMPIIIATGYSESILEHARSCGVRRIVRKPVLIRELHDAIRQELDAAPAAGG
jgi:two-component system, cell cycle sensor histidine kinase and response regulator CckA